MIAGIIVGPKVCPMGIMILATGTPETSDGVRALTAELIYAIGRDFDLDRVVLPKADTIVLNVNAIAPSRGVMPNGTSHKRSAKEFWTFYNIDFDRYVQGDAAAKLAALANGLRGAVRQLPDNRMSVSTKEAFEAAVEAGIELLMSEPDRLRPFQAPLI
jgi:hypothetical protein